MSVATIAKQSDDARVEAEAPFIVTYLVACFPHNVFVFTIITPHEILEACSIIIALGSQVRTIICLSQEGAALHACIHAVF